MLGSGRQASDGKEEVGSNGGCAGAVGVEVDVQKQREREDCERKKDS